MGVLVFTFFEIIGHRLGLVDSNVTILAGAALGVGVGGCSTECSRELIDVEGSNLREARSITLATLSKEIHFVKIIIATILIDIKVKAKTLQILRSEKTEST